MRRRRSGEPVALVTTAGCGDALRIGYQNRPDIFARHIVLPASLYATVIEARERIDTHGTVLEPLDTGELRANLHESRRWQPSLTEDRRATGYAGWRKAVQRTLDWVDVGQ